MSHLHVISTALDDVSKNYDNFILFGDFNNEPEEKNVKFPKNLPFEKYCQTKDLFNPDKNKILSHLHVIRTALDYLSKKYDNFILFGDFKKEPEEKNMLNFLNTYHLKNIVKQKTCFKNPDRPS